MDKWAIPGPEDIFPNSDDLYKTLDDFFRYFNIIEPPIVNKGAFV
jgi:hypothetical protein